MSQTSAAPAARRFATLDFARGTALLLAMLTHALVHFGGWEPFLPGLRLVTRMATPTFLVLFGAMIELVYMRKIRDGAGGAVTERLLGRALLCYGAFIAITVAAFATGKLGLTRAALSVGYFGAGRFGAILQIYAVLFALMPLLLVAYRRYGDWALLGAVALGWAAKATADATVGHLDLYPVSFLLGGGERVGPGVAPGLTFIAAGVALARGVRDGRWGAAALWVGLAGAVMVAAIWTVPRDELVSGLVGLRFRAANHPIYFAYGLLAAFLIAGMAMAVTRGPELASTRILAAMGRNSLFGYGFGNVALNLSPVWRGDPWVGAGLAALFLAALIWLTVDLERTVSRVDGMSGGRINCVRAGTKTLCDRMGRWIAARLRGAAGYDSASA